MSEKKWYAVYTKPRWEKKVAALLTKKNIDNYCPLNRSKKQWTDRSKIVYEPLFPSYVFVNVTTADHFEVLHTDGIFNLLYWLGRPAVIKNEEIEVIRKFLGEHQNIRVEQIKVNVDDKVKIVSGPLMELEGKVLEISHKRVRVLLPSLGYSMIADIALANLEKVVPEPAMNSQRKQNQSVSI